ncbi:hypothetical protein HFN76_33630 [Rhizobium laguerreae]|uniref:HEPN domain-containing protein n=1 Tax=Rhizobium laguerreae TaxID=1076926 RepID=UPI001C912A83|nr:HEPN domain-containing protein [Rhizobium laguerreae]MBY3517077.1 hypothetical protein [Rhizobium laguerreae]
MRVRTTFICGLDNVQLPKLAQESAPFADGYQITNVRPKIVELLRMFGNALGSVESGYLANRASAIVFRFSEIETDGPDIQACLEARVIVDMLAVLRLGLGLWLVKDNAVHFDRVWLSAHTANGPIVHNNYWASRMSSANGSYDPVQFSSSELRAARSFQSPLPTYIGQSGSPTMLEHGSLRFQRFQYFLGAARETTDVAMKIAQYCSGLEALVSTSQQELSHQVSERVACLVSSLGPERERIFKLVKQAYGYRSKAVHGASFKPADVGQLRDCSTKIDEIYRELYGLYFADDGRFRAAAEGTDEDANRFFIKLLLGDSSHCPSA